MAYRKYCSSLKILETWSKELSISLLFLSPFLNLSIFLILQLVALSSNSHNFLSLHLASSQLFTQISYLSKNLDSFALVYSAFVSTCTDSKVLYTITVSLKVTNFFFFGIADPVELRNRNHQLLCFHYIASNSILYLFSLNYLLLLIDISSSSLVTFCFKQTLFLLFNSRQFTTCLAAMFCTSA